MRMATSLAVVLATLTLTFFHVQGQPANIKSLNFWTMEEADRIDLIANFLAANEDLTKQLIKIAESLRWLQEGADASPLGPTMMPMVLDYLPSVFSSQPFKAAVMLAMDELSRTPVDQELLFNETLDRTEFNRTLYPVFGEAFNQTMQSLAVEKMKNGFHKFRYVNRLLMLTSARDYLFEVDPNKTTVAPQCYSDTMDFLDALIGSQVYNPDPRVLNLESYQWATNMFDSFGKPSGGIFKGSLHFVGSFDECKTVQAYIPNNASLQFGRRPHNYTTRFGTRFCRVSFNIPESLVGNMGADTHGIQLRLHWGMCMPDTCGSNDVAAMFQLGTLAQYNLPVNSSYCYEDFELSEDDRAIVAIVILSLLVAAVVLSTLYEAFVIFYNNNFATPPSPASSSIEDDGNYTEIKDEDGNATIQVAFVNAAFQPDEASQKNAVSISEKFKDSGDSSGGVLPVSYMHHREEPPVFKAGMSTSPTSNVAQQNKRSPPPSYTKTVRGKNTNEMVAPKLVKAFSALTNMPRILSGKKSASAIHCLHGIRFFSLSWVILGHTYNYGLISDVEHPTAVNLLDADAIFKRFTFQGILAGGFAVDTFFLLSGLLVTWLTLRDIGKKNGCMYWVMFYVHRFWRLTPLYMIVMMIFTCLHPYIADRGPLWPPNLTTATNCQKYWWTNLLYVNNLVRVDDMCMGWTWYLSNDMQFYWISPVFLLALAYYAPVGIVLTLGLLCGGIIAAFYQEFQYGGDIFSMHEKDSQYWDKVYITPWCRVAAYAVGMLLGYVIHKYKKRTLELSTAVIGWVVTWGVGLVLCYITFTKNKRDGVEWVSWFESLYESFSRPLWCLCIAWIIYACHNNRGGFINSILSWEGFLPLSRLTYAAYLVHPICMMIHMYSKRALIYVNDYDLAYLFMGHFVISFLAAFVMSVVAEAPALALEKLVFRMR